jgi:hypothetical protein
LALRGVGRESEAESVRFYGRRVTKVGPEVKPGLPPEGWGPLNKAAGRVEIWRGGVRFSRNCVSDPFGLSLKPLNVICICRGFRRLLGLWPIAILFCNWVLGSNGAENLYKATEGQNLGQKGTFSTQAAL